MLALETFSSVLNMPTMDRKTFAKCMHNLSVKNKEVKKKMLEMSRQAAREAHVKVDASLKNQEIIDVSVSYDVAGRDMGVDSAEFHIWQKGHADECDKNSMELLEPWRYTLH
ncbi:uncharacterized protein TNCV_1521061 [Trichonephila clavipes]|nr:uncharacterized protein TNCV_1521061 [Trichonephila clavipes]